jgi:hypothetical protein
MRALFGLIQLFWRKLCSQGISPFDPAHSVSFDVARDAARLCHLYAKESALRPTRRAVLTVLSHALSEPWLSHGGWSTVAALLSLNLLPDSRLR